MRIKRAEKLALFFFNNSTPKNNTKKLNDWRNCNRSTHEKS